MWTTEDHAVAAGASVDDVDPACWQEAWQGLWGRVAGRFARADLRWRAKAFVRGLLADLPRKNCWTIAEHAGDPNPDGMQHLLARAVWDQDKVRDDVRDWLVEHLGDPEATLVIDESGDLKHGTHTVGTQRQYTGTAGRVENAQVMVLLVYAGSHGHAIIDRELYLPRCWTDDPLERRGIGYVLAVACHHPVRFGGTTHRADALLRHVPARAWQCVSAGKGAKGHRYYDWAFLRLDHDGPAPPDQAGRRWLLVRRNRTTGELAFYRCWTPRPTPLAVLVRIAGGRWRIEERIKTGKGLAGLDQHQVRGWRSWYRWATLTMLAHAFLVVAALLQHTRHPPPPERVPVTCNEVSHLYATLVARPAADVAHRLRWSAWRRRHQARARTCHYQRQAAWDP
jgi:SRSO17 transposase